MGQGKVIVKESRTAWVYSYLMESGCKFVESEIKCGCRGKVFSGVSYIAFK